MLKRSKKLISILTLTTIVATNYLGHWQVEVEANELSTTQEEMLEGLTEEQQQALSVLKLAEANEGLMLDESIDLESKEEISVIVEFNEGPNMIQNYEDSTSLLELLSSNNNKTVEEEHQEMEEHIRDMFNSEESNYIEDSYTEVFNGMKVTLPANKVEELLEADVVKAIYNDEIIRVNPVETAKSDNILTNIPTSGSDDLGVAKLHSEGITGEGVKVAVLDTGIDYNHPDLRDAYAGGYDFVDDDNDPMETTYNDWIESGEPERDSSGNEYYTQHGTHVAGIIAGQGTGDSDLSVQGVAPGAEIYAYRVLGKYGAGYTSDILAGIERAIEDGVDVMNLSLGADTNNHLYPTSIAVNNAVLGGVVAVVSSGNSGPGTYTVGSPGTASLALTVGASTIDVSIETAKCSLTNDLDQGYDLKLVAKSITENASALGSNELEVVSVGNGAVTEYEGEDVEGKVVIIDRGMYTLHDLIVLAKSKGAVAVILHNNNESETHIPHYLGEDILYVPAFSISKAEGDLLKSNLIDSNRLSFMEFGAIIEDGDELADFSSQGPVSISYEIKPEVVAPGASINSTIPWFMDGLDDEDDYTYAYKKLDGTSMSAPYVAGIAALILQDDSSLEPLEVKSKIMNTSEPLNKEYSVYEVGAGRVNPYNAVKSEVSVSVFGNVVIDETTTMDIYDGDLNFGLITSQENDYESTRSIKIENTSEDTKIFDVQIIKSSEVGDAKDWNENGVTVDIAEEVTINSGSIENVDITINVPLEAYLGSYEGYVILTNKDNANEVYRVPFVASKIQQGGKDLYLDTNMIATPVGYYSRYIVGSADIYLSLNSPAEYITLQIVDGNTNEAIGVIGILDASGVIPNEEYTLEGFNGQYIPIIDDNQYGNEFEKLNTGNYILRMISTDSQGQNFNTEFPFYVDNKLPEIQDLTLTTTNGEIEVTDKAIIYEFNPIEESSIAINGVLYDEDLDKMVEAGIDPFSRSGFEEYYDVSSSGGWLDCEVTREGIITGEIIGIANKTITKLQLQAVDATGNTSINDVKYINLVKEGTKYVSLVPEQMVYGVDETPVISVNVNNATDLKELTFEYKIRGSVVNIEEFNLLHEYKNKATIEYEKTIDSSGYENIEGKIIFDEPINTNGEVLEIAEVILKTHNTDWYNSTMSLLGTSYYVDSAGTSVRAETLSITYNNNPEKVLARVESYLGEGLVYETSGIIRPTLGESFDYSTLGIEVAINDLSGNQYEVYYDLENDWFESRLPVENKAYDVTIDIPGHFTIYRDFVVDRMDQIQMAHYTDVNFQVALAGDVNKDNVIDVNDAIEISRNYSGENTEEYSKAATASKEGYDIGDINFDGSVNSQDLEYVKANYGIKNAYAANAPEPVLEVNGVTLDDIAIDIKDGKITMWLQKIIEEANTLVPSDYTELSYEAVKSALDSANDTLADVSSTQEVINNVEKALKDAIEGLVEQVFTNHLRIAIKEANKITNEELEDVVPVFKEEFITALEEATSILEFIDNGEVIAQEIIDASFTRLSQAMHTLSFKGDRTEFLSLFDDIKGLEEEKDKFIYSTWDNLQNVLYSDEIQEIINNENSLQGDIDKAYVTLMKGYLNLRLKPSKDKLQELIGEANSISKAEYTEQSYKKLSEALESALDILAKEEATESEVKEEEAKLEAALKSLVKVEDSTGDNSSEEENDDKEDDETDDLLEEEADKEDNSTESEGNIESEDDKLPQTGGISSLTMGAIALILVIIGIKFSKIKENA